jgi:hypothetical protein
MVLWAHLQSNPVSLPKDAMNQNKDFCKDSVTVIAQVEYSALVNTRFSFESLSKMDIYKELNYF